MASEQPEKRGRVTRFQVMAVLQAARAYSLGLSMDEAKSWGLNRAIFYAAAKRSWQNAKADKRNEAKKPEIAEYEYSKEHHDPVYVLGGERAFRARNFKSGLRFKFGAEVQTPEEFDIVIKARFPDWKTAWTEARAIISAAARRDLDIQSRFFNEVYRPRRDLLAERWSNMEPPKTKAA